MIVVDSNLLVYAHRAQTPEHDTARTCLESASRHDGGWGIAQTSVLEFWAVVTHPSASGRPSRPDEARAFLDSLIDAGARILEPVSGIASRLLETADRFGVVGPRIFDLAIALTALDGGATELWTHDRGFVTLPGLLVVDPLSR